MTVWNHGTIDVLDGKVADRYLQDVMRKHGIDVFGNSCSDSDTEFEVDGYPGDIETGLSEAVRELFESGYRLEGTITYFGDYYGGYEICPDGTVKPYDAEGWCIRPASDYALIQELKNRGYIIQRKCNTALIRR